ncbi:unnamed protein product [Schistosoma margrebowiei]|uniref:Uncharacterized protein n=1 Tax=Schistosoma margrebowiei TaxID=48269 RepID=A0A183M1C6_9TREM|nr:unnamed protein product [Schistosoma margrebowiei]
MNNYSQYEVKKWEQECRKLVKFSIVYRLRQHIPEAAVTSGLVEFASTPRATSSYSENAIPPTKPRRMFRKFLFLSLISISSFIGLVYVSETIRNELISYYPPSKDILHVVENSIGGWYTGQKAEEPVVPVGDFPLPPKRTSESISQVNSVATSEPVIIEKKKHSLPTVEEVKDMIEKRDHVPVMNVDFCKFLRCLASFSAFKYYC